MPDNIIHLFGRTLEGIGSILSILNYEPKPPPRISSYSIFIGLVASAIVAALTKSFIAFIFLLLNLATQLIILRPDPRKFLRTYALSSIFILIFLAPFAVAEFLVRGFSTDILISVAGRVGWVFVRGSMSLAFILMIPLSIGLNRVLIMLNRMPLVGHFPNIAVYIVRLIPHQLSRFSSFLVARTSRELSYDGSIIRQWTIIAESLGELVFRGREIGLMASIGIKSRILSQESTPLLEDTSIYLTALYTMWVLTLLIISILSNLGVVGVHILI